MKVSECSGSTLAYLGDAVFSLLVREHLIEKGYGRAKDLQRESIRYVSAKAQAHFFHTLENEGFFTEDELEIYRRGRNFRQRCPHVRALQCQNHRHSRSHLCPKNGLRNLLHHL